MTFFLQFIRTERVLSSPLGRKYYSSMPVKPGLDGVKPIITYGNADEDKLNILADNRKKNWYLPLN